MPYLGRFYVLKRKRLTGPEKYGTQEWEPQGLSYPGRQEVEYMLFPTRLPQQTLPTDHGQHSFTLNPMFP